MYRYVFHGLVLGSEVLSHSQQGYACIFSIFVSLVLNALLLADFLPTPTVSIHNTAQKCEYEVSF
jgi:hypothetical protein